MRRSHMLLSALAVAAALLLGLPLGHAARPIQLGIPTHPSVVGGENAPQGRLTYQLGYQVGKLGLCGASHIREDVALTAAHCGPKAAKNYLVFAGAYKAWFSPDSDGTPYTIAKAITHPGYDGQTNDLGLLFLSQCVPADKARPIQLATDEELSAARSGRFVVSGWGTTSEGSDEYGQDGDMPSVMQFGVGSYVGQSACSSSMQQDIQPSQICIMGEPSQDSSGPPNQDTCQGDSGGPVMFNTGAPLDPVAGSPANDRLIGVTSYGYGCGQSTPGVYTNVAYFKDWITWQLDANRKPGDCGKSQTLSFELVDASANWFGKPGKSSKLKAGQGAADCQALCQKSGKPCAAFSVSVVPGKSGKPDANWCDIYYTWVPQRVCKQGDTEFKCTRTSAGSYRAKWS